LRGYQFRITVNNYIRIITNNDLELVACDVLVLTEKYYFETQSFAHLYQCNIIDNFDLIETSVLRQRGARSRKQEFTTTAKATERIAPPRVQGKNST
jgi:hypothetical protein